MRIRGIPPIMSLTRLAEAQRRQLFTFTIYVFCQAAKPLIYTEESDGGCIEEKPNPWCIQKETIGGPIRGERNPTRIQGGRSDTYTGDNDPSSIQEEVPHLYRKRSDIYTEGNDGGPIQKNVTRHVYRRKQDPTCMQNEPSWALNEVTIDWSSEITTEACRQSWVLVRAINPRCCLQAVDIDGFLLRFGVLFFCAVNVLSEVCWQHLTGRIQHYQTCFSFNEWGVRGVLLFFLSKPS